MGSDSITNKASSPVLYKYMTRKKKGNRSAKLKRDKLDVRREQWLSQADSKIGKGSPDAVPLNSLPKQDHEKILGKIDSRCRQDGRNLECIEDNTGNLGPKHQDSGSSSGSYSGSLSDGDNNFDDWEAMADALNLVSPPPAEPRTCQPPSTGPSNKHSERNLRSVSNCRAWRSDDAFRPVSLPNLSRRYNFSGNSRHCGSRPSSWARVRVVPPPSLCPICCEDLDVTDSSFLPCPCGFKLCLFCHKRILEDDGRCPGCRKPYGPVDGEMNMGVCMRATSFHLPRTCRTGQKC